MVNPPPPNVQIPREEFRRFLDRWGISDIALFGSVLRSDFRADSDIDVLVTFDDPRRWRLRDLMQMEDELSALFGRRVELTERAAIEENPNWIVRRSILDSAQSVDVA
jgi:predicted nucleotidyltransferase